MDQKCLAEFVQNVTALSLGSDFSQTPRMLCLLSPGCVKFRGATVILPSAPFRDKIKSCVCPSTTATGFYDGTLVCHLL